MANGGNHPGVRRPLKVITAEIKVLMKELEMTAKEGSKLKVKKVAVAKKSAKKK